jgi:Carboxypeptidase regulatory-like domain
MKSNFTKFLFPIFALLLMSDAVFGQGSMGQISGKISNGKESLVGAAVQVKNTSTGFKAGTVTDVDGNYQIVELPLGGPYEVEVSYVGHQTTKQTDIMVNQGNKFTFDFVLKEGTSLGEVVVTANTLKANTNRFGSALTISGRTIATIPTPSRNFEQLAFLSGQSYTPEVGQRNLGGFTLSGGKGGNGGFTVDGGNTRRPGFGATLDGAAFTISQEAIREFEVETNDYDVKSGRNSGGVVKAVTKSGTNEFHAGVWTYAGGGKMAQTKNPVGAPLSSVPGQNQFGASVSGPIIKDKLFFFGVFDRYKAGVFTDPRTQLFLDYDNSTFSGGNTEAETFYGFKKADADAVLAAGKAKGYDVGGGIGNLIKEATTTNVFARLDWNINSKNTFAIRYNYLDYFLTNEGNSGNGLGLNTPVLTSVKTWGTNAGNYPFVNLDHRITADLRTQISNKIVNKFLVQYISSNRANQPKDAKQEPRVYVGIPAANGLSGGMVTFGQLTWIPEQMQTKNFQIIDDVTINTDKVTWTFGTNNQFYNQPERLAHWTAPVVVYPTIADLNADKPSFYRQMVSNALTLGDPVNWKMAELGLYAQASFKVGTDVKIDAGIRWDAFIQYGNKPVANTTLLNSGLKWHGAPLDNQAGLNSTKNFQPRFNLTWDIKGEQKDIFKAGFGLFTSPISTQPVTQSYYNDGVTTKRVDFTNNADIMANVGAGNFADPTKWLSAKINPGGEAVPTTAANIIMMDPNFKMPSTLRMNSSFTHFFNNRFKATVTGFFNVGFNDTYWVNANRKVGSTNPVDGREVMIKANDAVADVIVHTNADWNSKYMAAQLDLTAKVGKDGLINLTLTKARGMGVTTYHSGGTFDDAEFVGGYYFDRFKTHSQNSYQNGVGDKVVLIFASPEVKGFSLGFSFMAAHQRRFNVVVASGNPDGTNARDLAYVPELTQPVLTSLSNVGKEVRDVLFQSEGQITGVYQGVYPWMYQTSASLSKKFKIGGKYGVTIRADVFNILNAISPNAGYYKNLNSSGDDFSAGRFINLFRYNAPVAATATAPAIAGNYTVDGSQGTYIRGGQPYSVQLGAKFDF